MTSEKRGFNAAPRSTGSGGRFIASQCLRPRREVNPALQADQQEEQRDPDARPQRWLPVAREDRDQRAEHPFRRLVGEEQIAELRSVETEDEPPERAVALALPTGVPPKAPRGEIARGERVRH